MMSFPEAASAHAGDIDSVIHYVHWLMYALFVGWGAFFLYVLVRFRKGRNPKADYTGVKSKTSTWLEVAVAAIEGVLLIGFSIPLWADRVDRVPAASESTVVRVVAQQFAWNVWYPGADGKFGRADISLMDEATAAEDALPIDVGPPQIVKPSHEIYGELLLEMGRPVEARAQFEKALARAPRRSLSLAGLARTAQAEGTPSVAARACAELAASYAGADASVPLPPPCGAAPGRAAGR